MIRKPEAYASFLLIDPRIEYEIGLIE